MLSPMESNQLLTLASVRRNDREMKERFNKQKGFDVTDDAILQCMKDRSDMIALFDSLMNAYELRAIQSNVNLREWMSHRRLLTLEKWAHRKLKRRFKRFKDTAFHVLRSDDYNHICEVTGEP
jgi:hypothetical protein